MPKDRYSETSFIVQSPNENFTLDDFLGNEKTKKQLKRTVSSIICPKLFLFYGIKPEKSIMLEGLPGNGKTYALKCIQGELLKKNNFYGRLDYNIGEHGTAYINENSRNIQEFFDEGLFNLKEKFYNGMLYFIDEAETILTNRGHRQSKEDKKMLETLMKNLQNLHDRNENETIFFATNYVGAVDKAAMRSGRVDSIITFTNPSEDCRKELFNREVDLVKKTAGYNPFKINSYKKLAQLSEGFSCADCRDIIGKTLREELYDTVEAAAERNIIGGVYVNQKRIEEEIQKLYVQKNKGKKPIIGFGK